MNIFSLLNSKLERLPGAWLIFIGALCWSTAGAVVKSFDTDPFFLAGLRSLLGGLVLSVFIRPRKIRFDKWLLLSILFYAGMVTCAMNSFRLTSATLVIAMQYTAPIWLFLLSWLLTKKPQKGRAPVMLLIIGAVLLFLLEPASGATIRGNLIALNMGIMFAGVSVCLKKVRHDNPLGVVAVMNLGGALILLPLALALPGAAIHVNASDWPYILYLAVFQLSAGYFFYMLGIKKVTPQKGTLLCVWEMALTPVWAFLIVREIPSLHVAIGTMLLLFALFWDNRVDSRLQPGKAN
jgi:drug/metabolite transporter (DMT)-like permease